MTEKVSSLLTQSGRRPIWDTCSQWSCALARRHNLVVFFLREARLILSVRRAFIGFVKFEEPDDHWTPNMQRHLYSFCDITFRSTAATPCWPGGWVTDRLQRDASQLVTQSTRHSYFWMTRWPCIDDCNCLPMTHVEALPMWLCVCLTTPTSTNMYMYVTSRLLVTNLSIADVKRQL